MKVLLVEDEPQVGRTLCTCLKRWHMHPVLARGPQQALDYLEEHSIDLLITDLAMPGMDGIEMVRRIRLDQRHQHLPVLMVSGRAHKQLVVAASAAGINGFVAKPFTPGELKKKIQLVLRQRRQRYIDQVVEKLAAGRTSLYNQARGPLIVFGEAIHSAEELRQPGQRPLLDYLGGALEAMEEANARHPDLGLGFAIENNTSSLVAQLRKPATRKWVKLVLLSTRCRGNPVLIVRLFTLNHRREIPIVLVYDHPGELSPRERAGFEKLGVYLIRRAQFDRERFAALIDQYALGGKPPAPRRAAAGMAPRDLRQQILADIEAMTTLPPLPRVYEKILQLARDPRSDLRDWIAVIEVDPLTCAAIFRHVNALNYGFEGRIGDIDRAIILLGKRIVLGLVASEAARQAFAQIEEQGFDMEAFWQHNLAAGFAAHILALPPEPADPAQQKELAALKLPGEILEVLARIDLPRRLKLDYERENPFLGGLMHDLGRAVLVHAYPGLFPLLLNALAAKGEPRPLLEAEREVAGGLTHAVAGEILARKWQLDDELCRVILLHHQPDIDDSFSFLIGLADAVAHSTHPFPPTSRPPVKRALVDGDLGAVRRFLPEGFFEQPLISPAEFTALARAIGPLVRQLTGQRQQVLR